MVSRVLFLLLALWPAQACSAGPAWVGAALELIEAQSLAAPRDQHGFLNREYRIQDLNRDGVPEVLECVPDWEANREFLNVEMAPAFEWIVVYQYDGRVYEEATSAFDSFLRVRRAHYELWLRLIESPVALSLDSQTLIQVNQSRFSAALQGHIAHIDRLLSSLRPN